MASLREAAKKSSALNDRAIKRGGGVKGRAIKENMTFLETFVPTFQRPLSSREGGGV